MAKHGVIGSLVAFVTLLAVDDTLAFFRRTGFFKLAPMIGCRLPNRLVVLLGIRAFRSLATWISLVGRLPLEPLTSDEANCEDDLRLVSLMHVIVIEFFLTQTRNRWSNCSGIIELVELRGS
jgi:hypothetical protein